MSSRSIGESARRVECPQTKGFTGSTASPGQGRKAAMHGRRAFLSMGLGTVALMLSRPVTAAAMTSATARERLWGTMRLNLGTPTKLMPQAAVLDHQIAKGASYAAEAAKWNELVTRARRLEPLQRLEFVHATLQRHPYRPDYGASGPNDRWLSPLEFMRSGGDCEDFAIAKFKALEAADFPQEDLRVVIVRNTMTKNFHAVLAAYIGGRAYILDNLSPTVYPHAERIIYDPVCSMNRSYLWLHWHGTNLNRRVALLRNRLTQTG